MSPFTLVIALLVVCFVAWVLLGRAAPRPTASDDDYEDAERAYMPSELASARLVLSEEYLKTDFPRPLGARFDQVYLTEDGVLVPVDTKRRRQATVYLYDQIEVSVQGAVLRHARSSRLGNHAVAGYGYVRVVREGRPPTYLRFNLLSDQQLADLVDRYERVLDGRIKAQPTAHAGKCRRCAYLSRCSAGQQRLAKH